MNIIETETKKPRLEESRQMLFDGPISKDLIGTMFG